MEKACRPWGYFEVLAEERDHKVKRIFVLPGQLLSLQRHRRRNEHWYLVSGAGTVTLNNEALPFEVGAAIDIPCGAWHRVRNTGDAALVFIEIQTGTYFGEDDIERKADDYGRV